MGDPEARTSVPDAGKPELFYGIRSWQAWTEGRPSNLSSWKTSGATVQRESPFEVTEYSELLRLVSFLNVMNKKHHLLFRGQSEDWPLLPSLLRDSWTPPSDAGIGPVALVRHRSHYLKQLDLVRNSVVEILVGEKRLPRWRPFKGRRLAAWAVIQHYEIWPTPLIDLTSSLRVAASFALGLTTADGEDHATPERSAQERHGYLSVFAVPELLSDFMDLDENSLQMQALRLNSVCPPDAARPHFQEGFLLTWPKPGTGGEGLDPRVSAHSKLVAKFRLLDTGRFWTKDFPQHTQASLLPGRDHDVLLREFRQRITYQLDGERLVAINA